MGRVRNNRCTKSAPRQKTQVPKCWILALVNKILSTVDLFTQVGLVSRVLPGSALFENVAKPHDLSKVAGVGYLYFAIKPNHFIIIADVREQMQYLYQRIIASQKVNGVDCVFSLGRNGLGWT